MKHDWEYKKLGEVCDVVTKGTTPTTVGFKFIDKGINFVKVECFENGRLNKQKMSYVSDECHNALLRSQLKENDILFCIAGSIGKTAIVTKDILPANTNQACCIIRINSEFSNDRQFILWFLQSNKIKKFIESLKTGIAQPNLTLEHVRNFQIPDISTTTKTSIVSELDSLSKIIADCKETLKDYDALEQSIFYDMFGDPVKNDKGWEVKKLKTSVVEMFLGPFGSALKVDSYVSKENSYCMVYEQKHAIKGTIDLDNHYIDKEKYESLARFEVLPNDFIMSCRGTIGKLFQLPSNAPKGIIHPSLMKIRIKTESYNYKFFSFMLVKIVAEQQTNGNCVQMAITAKELGNIDMILPPLPLQQQFASKIEAIEKMKSETKKALQEAETLFNARMDYWFN